MDALSRRFQLDFEIGDESRKKILLASALPIIVLGAHLVQLALEIVYSPADLAPQEGFLGGAPELWQRLYLLCFNVQVIQAAAVASLFAAALFSWTRPESSWMLIIAVLLVGTALALAAFKAMTELITEDSELANDLLLFSWQRLASTCGLMAIGYFFLAYQGVGADAEAPATGE
jgi:hypothetical protein